MYEVAAINAIDYSRGIRVGMRLEVKGIYFRKPYCWKAKFHEGIIYEVRMLDWVNTRADGSGFYYLTDEQIRRVN